MQRHLLIYDGQCPFCCRTARWLERLDWLGCLRCAPAHEAQEEAQRRGVSAAQLLEALHCLSGEGRVYRGAEALRFAGLRLPLLCVPALVLYVPGALWVAERVYRAVAARRQRLIPCSTGACPPGAAR
jgi:predicted DCC family thiol-disulfide oxidoreductase YuxK